MAKLCSKLVFILLDVAHFPTLANNSEAAIEIGGLVIKKSENIAMLSEKLFVSEKIINVQYEFVNNSSNDILTIVAFPLPENAFDPSEHEDKLKFSARVEGEKKMY